MKAGEPLELERPRDLGALLGTALVVYRRSFWKLVAIGFAVSLTVNGIVLGVGLEQIWSGYDPTPPDGETLVVLATSLLTTPLIFAMVTFVLRDVAAAGRPQARAAIQRGLDLFPGLLLAVVVAAAGVAAGFLALVLPGIYLAIRWSLVVQVVAVEEVRGPAALGRSGKLVEGSWWRVAGIVVLAAVLTTIPGIPVGIGLGAAAEAADSAAIALGGQIVLESLLTPLNGLIVALLYFDLRARHRAL